MSDHHNRAHAHNHDQSPHHGAPTNAGAAYRSVLWIALIINASMVCIELAAGALSGSVSLLADALDFFSDAVNYGISLLVLTMAIRWRSRAAIFKATTMLAFGLFVLGKAAWGIISGVPPEALTMGLVGLLALAANLTVAFLLYQYREGDANMRSVWICTRNDAIGNIAVVLAALGVFGTRSAWPDLLVAAVMGSLAIQGALTVLRQARHELRLSTRG